MAIHETEITLQTGRPSWLPPLADVATGPLNENAALI
jgi:hypothetical protein